VLVVVVTQSLAGAVLPRVVGGMLNREDQEQA
jgi:hypothetical protein